MRRGKNVDITTEFLKRAIQFVDTEQELLNLKLQYPQAFILFQSTVTISPIYLSKEATITDLMELITPLFESKIAIDANGKPVDLPLITAGFEWLFNVSFSGNERKFHENILNRKKDKTKFLDKLRHTLLEINNNNIPLSDKWQK